MVRRVAVLSFAALLASGFAAQSATIKYGETRDALPLFNIIPVSGSVVPSNNDAYAAPPESGDGGTPADWVWVVDPEGPDTAQFSFTFDLTNADLASVVLQVDWSVDNWGWVELNGDGNLGGSDDVSVLPDQTGNFRAIESATVNTPSSFVQGQNTLTFYLRDRFFDDPQQDGGPAAFTAAVSVTATPIPLPAAGWLLIGGLGALGALRLRRRTA